LLFSEHTNETIARGCICCSISLAPNTIAIATVTALGVRLWSHSPGLALVIAIAMVISMALAGLAGAAIPLILTRFRQDPAESASIILTTVTDVTGFLSFLGLATLQCACYSVPDRGSEPPRLEATDADGWWRRGLAAP
jgi:Mg/Co/Ni transporter MgtE